MCHFLSQKKRESCTYTTQDQIGSACMASLNKQKKGSMLPPYITELPLLSLPLLSMWKGIIVSVWRGEVQHLADKVKDLDAADPVAVHHELGLHAAGEGGNDAL